VDPEIDAYYDRGDEQGRLSSWGRLELVRTQELLLRFLPPPPARVLDVGGGPGAYAVWLAERGHDVELVDPVELHLSQARAAGVAHVRLGDARELPFGDASADAVLALGPLYHLPDAADRRRALEEALRVLRPGGVLAAAAISRFASTIDGLFKDLFAEPGFEQVVEGDLRDGRHENPDRHPRWFTTAYLHVPEDLGAEVAATGFALVALLGIEGPGAFLPDIDDRLDDPVQRASLLRALARVEAEPSLLGASPHVLAVGRKPG